MSKSPSLRRIQADIRELSIDPSDRYHAAPLESDMFEWHFTIRGADDTEFEGGIYHGRILLPAEYPFKPPNIIFLTPNGRFEINTKVCLSFSAFHPELWQPAWGIRLILEALISFLPTPGDGAIGALDWTKEERQRLAKESVKYVCPKCGLCSDLLPKLENTKTKKITTTSRFQKDIEKLHALQATTENTNNKKDRDNVDDEEKESEQPVQQKEVSITEKDDSIIDKYQQSESKQNVNDGTVDATSLSGEEQKAADSQLPESGKPNISKVNQNDLKAAIEHVSSESNNTETPVNVDEGGDLLGDRDELARNDTIPNYDDFLNSPWLSDSIVHTGLVCTAIIIFVLVRKVNEMMDELAALEGMYAKT
jgi:ubiquitin-conjugating enzyme E2 J1